MKKTLFLTLFLIFPITLNAAPEAFKIHPIKTHSIPRTFSMAPETAVLEWGCPVSDLVMATSSSEAIRHISNECRNEVSKAALNKPDVFEVIETSVIWPDVQVSEERGGFRLTGTLFLETLVLQGSQQ